MTQSGSGKKNGTNNLLVLTFDMETDVGSWSSKQRGIREGSRNILDILKNHSIRATFLFTAREAEANAAIVRTIVDQGHEVGCRTMFQETVGVPVYDVPVCSFILEEEIESRLSLATNTIENTAGIRPVSFRAPRLFGSTTMIQALENLGYLVDSSFPAYCHGTGFLPYHPSPKDWSRPGTMRILEMPLFYDAHVPEDEHARHMTRSQWPILRLRGPDCFADLCRRMFVEQRNVERDSSTLCIYLHPWEFVEMPRKIVTEEATIVLKDFLHHNTGDFSLHALDRFIGKMIEEGVKFMNMKKVAETYWHV